MAWKKLKNKKVGYNTTCEFRNCNNSLEWALCFDNGEILAVYCDEHAHRVSESLRYPATLFTKKQKEVYTKKSKTFKSSKKYLKRGE